MTKLEKFLDAIAVCEQNGTLWTHVKVADEPPSEWEHHCPPNGPQKGKP